MKQITAKKVIREVLDKVTVVTKQHTSIFIAQHNDLSHIIPGEPDPAVKITRAHFKDNVPLSARREQITLF